MMEEVPMPEAYEGRGLAGPFVRLSLTGCGIAGGELGAMEFCCHACVPSPESSVAEGLRPKHILASTA